MARIGLFYSENDEKDKDVAMRIVETFGERLTHGELPRHMAREIGLDLLKVVTVDLVRPEDIAQCEFLIFGTSTCYGELHRDWQRILPKLASVDFTGKTVALYDVSDDGVYRESFAEGMGILYQNISKTPAKLVGGAWSSDGYDFKRSKALVDGSFVGLVLDLSFKQEEDEEETANLNEARIAKWFEQIKGDFGL